MSDSSIPTSIYQENSLVRVLSCIIQNNFMFGLLFLFYPIITLPIIFYGIYYGKKNCFFFLALFIGLYASLLVPQGDLYRYYEMAYQLECIDFKYIPLYLTLKGTPDFLMYYLQWAAGKLSLANNVVVFFMVSCNAWIFFYIYCDIIKKSPLTNSEKFLVFLAYFILVKFAFTYFRSSSAVYLMGLACYLLLVRGKNIGWLFAILASLMHFSMIISFAILILVKSCKYCGSKIMFLVVLFLYFTFKFEFLTNILMLLPFDELLMSKIRSYGAGGEQQEVVKSIGVIIMDAMQMLLSLVNYYIIYKTYRRNIWHGMMIASFALAAVLGALPTIQIRFMGIVVFITQFIVIEEYSRYQSKFRKRFRKPFIYAVFTIGLFVFLMNTLVMQRYWRPYRNADKFLYSSTIGILSKTDYTESWIENTRYLNED